MGRVETSKANGGAVFGTNPAPRPDTVGWSGSRWQMTCRATVQIVVCVGGGR